MQTKKVCTVNSKAFDHIYIYIQLMFTCGITPRNDFIFPLDTYVKVLPVMPQL